MPTRRLPLKQLCDRLYKEVAVLKARMGSLMEIAVLATTADPQAVFDKVLEHALALTEARAGSLMVAEEESLRIVAFRGLDAETARESRPRVGQGIAGWVAKHGRPLLLRGGDKSLPLALERPIKDALSIPLRISESTVGVLNVNDSPPGRTFGHPDRELLSAFANEAALVVRILRDRQEIENTYMATIQAFAEAIDAKDPYTAGHSRRVSDYAFRLAREMQLPEPDVKQISMAALMHDVGKIGISEDILGKPEHLDSRETGLIQTHPVISARILQPILSLRELVPLIRHHHEHYDGRGYPAGLSGEEIPFGSRVLAVVDAFDAMASGRVYREVMSLEEILDELIRHGGRQFDPRLVDVFVRAINNGRIPIAAAVIVGQEGGYPPMPTDELRGMLYTRPGVVPTAVAKINAQLRKGLETLGGGRLAEKVGLTFKAVADEAHMSAVSAFQKLPPERRYQECSRYFIQVRDYLLGLVGDRLTERLLVEAADGLDTTSRDFVLTIFKEIGIDSATQSFTPGRSQIRRN